MTKVGLFSYLFVMCLRCIQLNLVANVSSYCFMDCSQLAEMVGRTLVYQQSRFNFELRLDVSEQLHVFNIP